MHTESINNLCIDFYNGAKQNLKLDKIYTDTKGNKLIVINKILDYTRGFCYDNNVHLDIVHRYDDVLIFKLHFDYVTYLKAVIYYEDQKFVWDITKHNT